MNMALVICSLALASAVSPGSEYWNVSDLNQFVRIERSIEPSQVEPSKEVMSVCVVHLR
jgi:hypothetical protein